MVESILGPVLGFHHTDSHSAVFDCIDFAEGWEYFEDMAILLADIPQVQGQLGAAAAVYQAVAVEDRLLELGRVVSVRSWTFLRIFPTPSPPQDTAGSTELVVVVLAAEPLAFWNHVRSSPLQYSQNDVEAAYALEQEILQDQMAAKCRALQMQDVEKSLPRLRADFASSPPPNWRHSANHVQRSCTTAVSHMTQSR